MSHNFNEAQLRNLTLEERVHYGIVAADLVDAVKADAIESLCKDNEEVLETTRNALDEAIELLEDSQDADDYATERAIVEEALSVLRGIDL